MWALYGALFLGVIGFLGLLIGLGWFVVPVALLFGPPLFYALWWAAWLVQERQR